jgi:hypothetical protein
MLGLLLFSVLVIFVPTSSAGPLKITPVIDVSYPSADKNLVPLSGALPITLKTQVTLSGVGSTLVKEASWSLIKDSPITVNLEVLETEGYIDATIDKSQVTLIISEEGVEKESYLKITVTEQAPAFTQGRVKIKAKSQALDGILFSIKPAEVIFDVSFTIGYWPVVNYELPKSTFMQIGPLDTATFPVEITNLGNGYTRVAAEIVNPPKGDWSISVISSVKLGSATGDSRNNKATVNVVIKPPYGFGFHNDRQQFTVRFTPNYVGSAKAEDVGQPEEITLNVQSIGMSPGAGFEIPLIVATLVIIGLIFYLFKKRK